MVGVLFLIGGIDAVNGIRRSLSWRHISTKGFAERTMPSKRTGGAGDDRANGTVSPVFDARARGQANATHARIVQKIPPENGPPAVTGSVSTSDRVARRGVASQETTARGMSGCCSNAGDRVKSWASRVPMDKIKILVVVFQILTVFPSVSGVEYPDVYSRFLSWVDVVNLDISTIFAASCMMRSLNFYGKLLKMTLVPIGLALLLVLTYWVAMRRADESADSLEGRAAWSRHMAAGLLLTFLVSFEFGYFLYR